MSEVSHYHTLGVQSDASQAEIKQAYRKLAKQFHPDRYDGEDNRANHDRIVAINSAYEVLSDTQRRQDYDTDRGTPPGSRPSRSDRASHGQKSHPRRCHQPRADDQIQDWLQNVYLPIDRLVNQILRTYKSQINNLAADPFDDELLENFQDYLDRCGDHQDQAERIFQSQPNPPQVARFAATLYYCLSHIGDGLRELGYFVTSYDENYLHTGREMFRLAAQLRRETQAAYRQGVG